MGWALGKGAGASRRRASRGLEKLRLKNEVTSVAEMPDARDERLDLFSGPRAFAIPHSNQPCYGAPPRGTPEQNLGVGYAKIAALQGSCLNNPL
jgi:hypothetical protein